MSADLAPEQFSIFGLRPHSGADKKTGGAPKRTARKGDLMLNILEPAVQDNAPERTPMRIHGLVQEGARTWSASEAALILDACRYPQTRDLRVAGEDHKRVLAEIMRRGGWRTKDVIVFARMPEGRLLLLNGHHRLGGQALSGQTIEWMVVIHDCRTVEEAESLYYSFDTNVRMRTNETILSAVGFHEKLGVSKSFAEAGYRAAPFIASGFHFGKMGRDPLMNRIIDRRLETVMEYARELRLYEGAIINAPPTVKRRLMGAATAAVAMATLRYQPEKAFAFWNGIAENDGLAKGDPRHTYLTTVVNAPRGGTAVLAACLAALAWRHFYNGAKVYQLRVYETNQPVIAGTPFKGR